MFFSVGLTLYFFPTTTREVGHKITTHKEEEESQLLPQHSTDSFLQVAFHRPGGVHQPLPVSDHDPKFLGYPNNEAPFIQSFLVQPEEDLIHFF